MRRIYAAFLALMLAACISISAAPASNAATLYVCTRSWQRIYTTSVWTAWTYTAQGWYCRPA